MGKEYCVYVHTNKTNGKRYVGITSNIPTDRWSNGKGYKTNCHFNYAIKKYGWDGFDHEVLFYGLTKEQACLWECALISQWNTTDRMKGYNIALGGVGSDSVSKSTRMLKSKQTKKYFIEHPEAKKHLAEIGHKQFLTDESKQAVSERMKKLFAEHPEKKSTKAIRQYDLSGNYIKDWESAVDVEKEKGYSRKGISACLNGDQKTSSGYIWKYADNNEPVKTDGIERKKKKEPKPRAYHRAMCGVVQYSLDGEKIKTYATIKEAEANTGIEHSDIVRCCRGKLKRAGIFIWRYNNDNAPAQVSEYNKFLKRPVAKCDSNGNILKIYGTAMEAAKEHGVNYTAGIHNACKGYRKHFKGHIWIYV